MKSYSVTIQVKAAEHYFPLGLLIMPYRVVLTLESVTTQMKATEWFFPDGLSCGAV